MRHKIQKLSNFSGAIHTISNCFRPDFANEIQQILLSCQKKDILVRGNGLSYSDCCLLNNGNIIDITKLNRFLAFDKYTGIVICEPGVKFIDLFELDDEFIPPVVPGTLNVTIGGAIANDVHGKNNHVAKSIGEHIVWMTIQINDETYHCDRETNSDLFYATIGGLGLTGVITKIAIRLVKSSQLVKSHSKCFLDLKSLLDYMRTKGVEFDYQVAWLDWLNKKERLVVSLASHIKKAHTAQKQGDFFNEMPFRYKLFNFLINFVVKFKLCFIRPFFIKKFNQIYWKKIQLKPQITHLGKFNNPLDKINNWNKLYSNKGLLQFQAVFAKDIAEDALISIKKIIKEHSAHPILVVLKYFSNAGTGLLSFTEPGFTIAIDFVNNNKSQEAIKSLNSYILAINGKIYLAKDLFLTADEFQKMYRNFNEFSNVLQKYNSPMRSDLMKRLDLRGANDK